MKDRSAWIHHNVLGDDIPYTQLSWLGKLSRTFYCSARRYGSDHQSQRAVALTYYTLFAVVPVMALVFGIAKGFSLEDKLQVFLEEKFANHQDVLNWIYQFADTTLKEAQGGVVAGVGVIALIWTVIWLASNIERAFNAVWNLPTRKNMFRRFSDYLAIILVTPIILVVMSSAGVFMRSMMGHILAGMPWLGGAGFILFSIMIKLFPLLLVILLFTLIYFLVPNTKVRFGSALLSGIVAGMLYQLLQDGFIYVQSALYRYNTIYGSFAALPLFLAAMVVADRAVRSGDRLRAPERLVRTLRPDGYRPVEPAAAPRIPARAGPDRLPQFRRRQGADRLQRTVRRAADPDDPAAAAGPGTGGGRGV